MKADVQKPIQSLHSFWRHFLGGSFAALPSNFLSVTMLVALFGCFSLTTAQQPEDTNTQKTAEKRLDALFNKIMQTMPDEVRERVDSASTLVREERRNSPDKRDFAAAETRENGDGERRLRARLNELPDDLKEQVEQTITEMQQRNEERKAQFRESRKNRHK